MATNQITANRITNNKTLFEHGVSHIPSRIRSHRYFRLFGRRISLTSLSEEPPNLWTRSTQQTHANNHCSNSKTTVWLFGPKQHLQILRFAIFGRFLCFRFHLSNTCKTLHTIRNESMCEQDQRARYKRGAHFTIPKFDHQTYYHHTKRSRPLPFLTLALWGNSFDI